MEAQANYRDMKIKRKTWIWMVTLPLFLLISTIVTAQDLEDKFVRGVDLYQAGEYAEAAPILESIVPIIRELYGNMDTTLLTQVLNITGLCYHYTGQYEKAEPFYQEMARINKKIYGSDHPLYAIDLTNMANLYKDMANYEKAETLVIEATRINKEALGGIYPSYDTDLNNLASIYIDMGQYEEAEGLMIKAVRILKEAHGEVHPNYGTYINNLGYLYYKMGRYKQAELLMVKAMESDKVTFGEDHPNYSRDLNNLALLYQDMGQYKQAEPLIIEAIRIGKEVFGENHPSYGIRLNNLATLYFKIGHFDKAEPLMIEAMQINEECLGTNHPSYARDLNNLAQLYRKMGRYVKAEQLMIKAMQVDKEVLGEYHPMYSIVLNSLAQLYEDMGQYERAESLMIKAMDIDKKALGENHPSYGKRLNNLAGLYVEMGLYERVESLYDKAMQITKEALGDYHPYYGEELNNLAVYYIAMGRYEHAEPLIIKAMQITKEVLGENHPTFGVHLNNLGQLYKKMGRYAQAELLMIEVMRIDKKALGENNLTYGRDLNNLADLYKDMGEYERAEPLMIEAKRIYKEAIGENNLAFGTVLSNLATLYIMMHRYEQAETLMIEAMRVNKRALGKKHPNYGRDVNNLAQLFDLMEKFEQAESLMIESIRIAKENFGENHPTYIFRVNNLAFLYLHMRRHEKVDELIRETFTLSKNHLRQNRGYLTEKELKQFIEPLLITQEINQSINYQRNNTGSENESFAQDIELFRKGILLKSTIQTRKSVLKSLDTNLILNYQKLITLRKQADRLYIQPIEERFLDPDSLLERANVLEKELSLQSKEYRRNVEEMDITWDQIQDNLQPREASVEFTSFNYYDKQWTDSTLYCALVLRKDFEYPKMVYLFEEKQFNFLLPSASRTNEDISKIYSLHHEESITNKIYNLIWNPLEPYLKGVEKVYISPSGELNKLAFHALPDTTGRLLCNKYDLIQLSSTREIALSKEDSSIETFALFGGVDYSLDTTEMLAMANEQDAGIIPRAIYRGDTTARGLTLSYLPGTMEEAIEIERECKTSGKEVEVYSGKLATEENFRSLEESESPDVIHIATHGFYFPEEKTRDREERMRFMQTEQENQFIYSPDPLVRSGLALAGANHAWKGEPLPKGVEDGILTARDVSRMNLMNTELVVLSACQTGLGDVKGSEGVYGLQRAFKMAGVRYLLMSLWKVPDESTKEFMVTFYKQLLSGESIRETYQITQQVMSAKYPNDPFRWAAFVLVE